MKIIGINFGRVMKGNCSTSITYCLNKFIELGYSTERVDFNSLEFSRCGSCDYECFKKRRCIYEDDISELYAKCVEADRILISLPSYGGNLPSGYFCFSERGQGYFLTSGEDYSSNFHDKLDVILIGNLEHGADSAMTQVMRGFTNKNKKPNVHLISSVQHGMNSIGHILMDSEEIQEECNRFIDRIEKKRDKVECRS